jgi:hypothetical protein
MGARSALNRGAAVAAVAVLLLTGRTAAATDPPPPDSQRVSFSVTVGSPLLATGVDSADILIAGPVQAFPCGGLGLLCGPTLIEQRDQLGGLSYGLDFTKEGPPVLFSVAPGARGAAGAALRAEADCSPAEPQADAFASFLDGSNVQYVDGDGVPCGANAGLGLGLTETPASDNLGSLAGDPCLSVDLDCDGSPEDPVFFTLAPGSPSLAMLGVGPADILSASESFGPARWASTVDLGLVDGDAIDALCLGEDGDGRYSPADRVAFSLAPGSPTLSRIGASPGDVLVPGGPTVFALASRLGLERSDDIDGMLCAFDILWRYLPITLKGG